MCPNQFVGRCLLQGLLRLLLRLAIGLDCMTCQDFVQMKVGAEIQAFDSEATDFSMQ